MSESAFAARLALISRLREACRRRADEPWLELFHYIVQLYRAYLDKNAEERNCSLQLAKLRSMAASLGRTDPDVTWSSVDELIEGFPWQADGYVQFSNLGGWNQRFPALPHQLITRLVEIDPTKPGSLRPHHYTGEKVWLVMGGNRTHINRIEWQDPSIIGEPLIKHAEAAMYRFLNAMTKTLGPMLRGEYHFVGLVPSTIKSHWECRLENFAVTRFPKWTHPRNRHLGRDILEQFGSALFERARGNVLSAYSLGCAAAEQLMNAVGEMAPSSDATFWSDSVYFAGYVGIRDDLGPRRRLQVVSLMDEAVFGSPDMPTDLENAAQSRWFSSPLAVKPNPWNEVPEDFDKTVAEHDCGCGWSTTRQVNDYTRLMILAGQSSIPADEIGIALLDHDTRMARTRFGHFLDATLIEFYESNRRLSGTDAISWLKR